MKNSRLFQILYLLMEHQELTAGWLAEKLEVSIRTIYRDLDALSASGIPVYCQKGKGGGIRLMEHFQLNRSLLDDKEQENLLTALQNLETLGIFDDSGLISRLSALFRKHPADWLEVDFDSWGSRIREQEYFEVCRTAILSYHVLRFTYYNSSGIESSRTVEPFRLCYKGGSWYLKAYCLQKSAFRLFRLNRISQLETLPETFLPQRIPSKSDFTDVGRQSQKHSPSSAKLSLTLRFTHQAAYQVMDIFLPEEISEQEDGSFLVCTSFPPGKWVLGFLLSFGKEVLVLEPESLREELAKESQEIHKLYSC